MTWVIHRARVSPVVCAQALCPCILLYGMAYDGILLCGMLPYGILWFGRLYPCPYVQMLLSLTIVCRNFKSHYLQTNVQTNVQINVQTNVQINVQTNVPTNIFFVNSDTTIKYQIGGYWRNLRIVWKQFVWKQFIISILSLVYLSCHITGHKATRMSHKELPAVLLNQVQLNTLIPIQGNISEQHQLKCFAQFLFRFMQEHNSLS